MKTLAQYNLIIGILICILTTACNAQHPGKEGERNGPPKPPSKEQIMKGIEHASKELGLNSSQKEKFKKIELDFHKEASELHKEGSKPGPEMKQKMDKLHKEKTDKLKAIFSESQMKKYLEMEKKRRVGGGEKPPRKN